MKFLSSLFGGIILSIILLLLLGLALKCDHANIIKLYSFQSENSTAMSYVKTVCEDCDQGFHTTLFRDNPTDEMYIDVMTYHIEDKTFVKGEYDTIKATIILRDYDATKTKIRCSVRQNDVMLIFSVKFKEEYEEDVSLLHEGDEVVFYGKSSLKGLSWTDCELITE